METVNNLKVIRKEKGLTQKQLAERMGTTQQNIALLEKSKDIRIETLRKLATVLECSLFDIFYTSVDSETLKNDLLEIDNEISALKKSLNNDSLSDPERHELKQTIDDLKEDKARIRFDLQMFGMDPEASDDEILNPFHKLNSTGKRVAVERVQELTEIPRYKKEK